MYQPKIWILSYVINNITCNQNAVYTAVCQLSRPGLLKFTYSRLISISYNWLGFLLSFTDKNKIKRKTVSPVHQFSSGNLQWPRACCQLSKLCIHRTQVCHLLEHGLVRNSFALDKMSWNARENACLSRTGELWYIQGPHLLTTRFNLNPGKDK